MGLDSRDYARTESGWNGGGFRSAGGGSTVKTIVIASIVVFLAQVLTLTTVPHPVAEFAAQGAKVRTSLVTDWLDLNWVSLQQGQIWRLLTYAFCHDPFNILHIVFNLLVLYFFGRSVEDILGPREFLRFYLVAAVASGIAYVVLALVTRDGIGSVVGASGAVYAVFAYYAMTYPRSRVYIMGVIPVEARWLLVAYVVFDMLPVIRELGGRESLSGVAHAAHLGGLAFGMWYKWSGANVGSWLGGFSGVKLPSRPRSNPNVRLYEPETSQDDLEQRVDELLDKIREHGEASLTDEERQFLKEASRQYRNR